jgi:mRNA interferase MazF
MTYSMSFSISEVILLPIPFTDLSSRRVRPAIVIGHSSFAGDLFVVPISSQLQNVDVALLDWRSAGLNVPRGIKSQLATIESRLVVKAIGFLSPRDQESCKNRLRAWLRL